MGSKNLLSGTFKEWGRKIPGGLLPGNPPKRNCPAFLEDFGGPTHLSLIEGL
jgi:hypothetical protein